MALRNAVIPGPDRMSTGQIRAGWPVAADALRATVNTANWLIGRGVPLVVDGPKSWPMWHPYRVEYYVHPSAQHSALTWIVCLSSTYGSVSSPLNARFQDETTGYGSPNLTMSLSGTPQVFMYTVTNPGTGPQIIKLRIDRGTTAIGSPEPGYDESEDPNNVPLINIWSTHLIETPRSDLPAAYGTDEITSKSQVYDGFSDRDSIAGLARAHDEMRTSLFKRGALFTWANPEPITGDSSLDQIATLIGSPFPPTAPTPQNSGAFVDFFPSSLVRPAIQTRHMYNGETTRTNRVAVRARVTTGTGEVRVSTTSGAVRTFTITNTASQAWKTDEALVCETDDYTRWDIDGGIRGGTLDEVNVQVKSPVGGSIYVTGVCIYNTEGD